MPTQLTTQAIELSTFVIRASFTDEAGVAVAPNAGLTWTLTDIVGNVVNSRSAVTITPATTITIVLHGNDLALAETYRDNRRLLTIKGTYNSTLGPDLELVDWMQFEILASPVVP